MICATLVNMLKAKRGHRATVEQFMPAKPELDAADEFKRAVGLVKIAGGVK